MEGFELLEPVAVVVLTIIAVALLAVACRRQPDDNPRLGEVADLVVWLLDRVERNYRKPLERFRQAEIEAAARAVYRARVTGTELEEFVDEAVFVGSVVATWRDLAAASRVVERAIQETRFIGFMPVGEDGRAGDGVDADGAGGMIT